MYMKEEQLELFEDPLTDEGRPDIGTRNPVQRMGYGPCPWCVGLADLATLQATLQSRTPPSFVVRKSDCGRCYGAGCIEVPVWVVEGLWWYEQGARVIRAKSVRQARRKAGNEEALVYPLRVLAGSYGVG